MSEHNKPRIKGNDVVDALRDQCDRRAAVLYFSLEEAKKRGLADDEWMRDVISSYGYDIGKRLEAKMNDPSDLHEFSENFGVGYDRDIYEMEIAKLSDDKFYLHFHYCPWVAKWQELGAPHEMIPTLCDVAMNGDRAIGKTFEKHGIKFVLGKTIAQGYPHCELFFDKVKG